MEYAEIVKEQRMKQEREINQFRETTRLENEEQERRWDRKQKEQGMKQERNLAFLMCPLIVSFLYCNAILRRVRGY